MSAFGPSSLDLLATQGIIPFDAQAYLTGEPSMYLQQCGIYTPPNPELSSIPPLKQQPLVDYYNPQRMMNNEELANPQIESKSDGSSTISTIKNIGAAALVTYLLGFICSKGKKNPIDGMKAIFNLGSTVVSKFAKIFKKS